MRLNATLLLTLAVLVSSSTVYAQSIEDDINEDEFGRKVNSKFIEKYNENSRDSSVENNLKSVFASVSLNVTSLECRGNICKVIGQSDPKAFDIKIQELLLKMEEVGWTDTKRFIRLTPRGEYVMFTGKPGQKPW